MATATESKSKAIVTTKLMADGTMKTVASKLIIKRLCAAATDCESLELVSILSEKAKAARTAIDLLLGECNGE